MSTETAGTERNWAHWTEPSWAEVDGHRVAYRRKGTGEPLLYLHGAGLTRQWLPVYEELSRSFDVIVPEHPGFGDTPLPDSITSFADLVLHYDAFLRELGLDRVHLVGHSMGGWLAADLALTYPTRFASLTLLAALGLRVAGMPDPFRWTPEAADHHVFSGVGASYASEYLEQVNPLEDMIQEYVESIAFARLLWNPRYDVKLEHRLARIPAPTQVVHFADDNYVPLAMAEQFAERIPDAALEVLPGADGEPASHVAFVQQPAAVATLVGGHAAKHPLAA